MYAKRIWSPKILKFLGCIELTLLSSNTFATMVACPVTSSQVQSFRDSMALKLSSSSDASSVFKNIESCFSKNIPECLKKTYHHSQLYDVAYGSGETAGPAFEHRQRPPVEMQLTPDDYLKWKVPADIEQIATQKGWTNVKYKSRYSGGFDETSSFLMIHVPGSSFDPPLSYDRWINIPLPSDKEESELEPVPSEPIPDDLDYETRNDMPSVMTMVTVEKATSSNPAEIYFQMFYRGSKTNVWTVSDSRSCGESCHTNGLRAISPLGYNVDDPSLYPDGESNPAWFKTKMMPSDTWSNVKKINDAMIQIAGGKPIYWRGKKTTGSEKPYFRHDRHWPNLGPTSRVNTYTRTQAFILGGTVETSSGTKTLPGCYKSRTKIEHTGGRKVGSENRYTLSANSKENIDWVKVKNNMNCSSCHNNITRGAINQETELEEIDFKILTDKSMPPGRNYNPHEGRTEDLLNTDERIALANCLHEELKEERKSFLEYLKGQSCEN